MGLTSLQVCMDSSDDWLQGTIHEENGMDSSSSPSGEPDMLTCSRPVNMMERRLRPQHEQALKCPRCDSTHTKFCYYNNYSLSQPRYFCKTCRRYWTKGGTLRNIPVGGGCRKNKKLSSKKSINNDQSSINHTSPNPTLSSFPDHHLHFPHHLNNLLPHHAHGGLANTNTANFMEPKYSTTADAMLENPTLPIDSTETKYDPFLGNSRNHGFMGIADLGIANFMSGLGDVSSSSHGSLMAPNFHGLCSPFDGIGNNFGTGSLMDSSCQRLMLPYYQGSSHEVQDHHQNVVVDVKPNTKLLSLEWQDRACSDAGKDSFGYLSGLGSWTGLMNGYGSSAANPLV